MKIITRILLGVWLLLLTQFALAQQVGDYRAVAPGGNWSTLSTWEICTSVSPATWATPTEYPGQTAIPGTVTITAGSTVSLDITPAHPVGNLIMEASSSFDGGSATLTLNGNFTNNGTFTASTGTVTMSGIGSTISGSSTTTFNILKIDNGGDADDAVTVSASLTVGELQLVTGRLSVTSGTTTINGLNNSTSHLIPVTAGLEVNGASAILNTGNFTILNEGLIRVADGTANLGTHSGNSVHTQVNGVFIVNNAIVNIAGRLENTAGGTLTGTTYPSGITISGGTVTLATVGNGASNIGTLNVTTHGYFNFDNGTIVFQNESSASTAIDLGLVDGSGNGDKIITNGQFQFGNSSTPANATFAINSNVPLRNISVYDGIDLELAARLEMETPILFGAVSGINLKGFALRLPASVPDMNFSLIDNSGAGSPVLLKNIVANGPDPGLSCGWWRVKILPIKTPSTTIRATGEW